MVQRQARLVGAGRLYTLDAVRGLAALAVAVSHLDIVGIRFVGAGHLAVDFFFALSGLVIGLSYQDRLRDSAAVSAFLRLRAIRIWPLYLVGTAIGFVSIVAPAATGWRAGDAAAAVLPALLMLPDPMTVVLYPANPPAWSLLYEFIANLLFAVVLVRLRLRWLAVVVLCAGALFVASAWRVQGANLGFGWPGVLGGVARAVFGFGVGLVLARVDPGARRRGGWVALVPIAMVLTPIVLSTSFATDLTTILILVPLAVTIGARVELPSALRPACTWLGDLSYPLYAIHYPLLMPVHRLATALGLGAAAETLLFLAIVVVLARALLPVDRRVRRALAARFVDADALAADQRVDERAVRGGHRHVAHLVG